MKKLLFLLLLPTLAFGQKYVEHPLPAKKPYPQVYAYTDHVPNGLVKMPLLIALTGFGENHPGAQLYEVLNPGIGSLLKHNILPIDSFVILLPQNTNRNHYYDVESLHKFIEFAKKNYNVDTTRVYITGLSGGAISLYNYLRKYSCTAAITCAGSGTTKNICYNGTTRTPIWVFHGSEDTRVTPGQDIIFVREYNKCTVNEKAQLTIYPGVAHDCWTKVYANDMIYRWFLFHRTTYK
jgi:predicted peptidase